MDSYSSRQERENNTESVKNVNNKRDADFSHKKLVGV
jgi:hypothetical protein